MYWAAFTTAFFGFLRCSEYTAPSPSHFDKDRTLLCSDLTIDGNGYWLHIKESKTDPFCLGVDLFLSRSHHSVCPVKALEKYMARSRSRALDLPLFSHADGPFLTPLRLTSMLRSLLHKLGYNEDQYAGHSFRIGAATTAAAAGLSDWLIKTLGRWSSDCYQRYIQLNAKAISSVANALAKAHVPTDLPSWSAD